MVVSKVALEAQISEGRLREENPLDSTDEFRQLCQACRLGDMGGCVEAIAAGANIDGRDEFDYSPLILTYKASLCGHYEVVQLLLESGALCQRDTFQGERCLYNALNDRIRNLLLRYEYSKSTHPLQPFASHITSLLLRALPNTSDITLSSSTKSFPLHKLILAARSPFFKQKLAHAPEIKSWRLPDHIAPQAVDVAIRFLYLGEISADIGSGSASPAQEQEILTAVEQLSRQLEIPALWDTILEGDDRRIARQGRSDEIVKCRAQLDQWYRENVLEFKVVVDSSKASEVRWDCRNGIFADVLLQADEDPDQESEENLDEEFKQAVLDFLYADRADFSSDVALDVLLAADLLLLDRLKAKAAVVISTMGSASEKTADVADSLPKVDRHADGGATDQSGEGLPINIYDVIRAGWLTRMRRLEEFGARFLASRLEDYIGQLEFAELIKESATRISQRQETDSIELLDE
ncbi:MAG: hypothetical protein M1826_002153 [Phylliscum demangeonii]|nr:MAG: hypothetical protein M1826_002153 [Phylliscum demangeonii]